ncbi:Uncharacterised protein [Mycobacteroides abscessus subsp. abscessus]|nr:Uncharacterised protein [Mycobacteroides abscessus subsp. abscessus]
MLRPGAPLRQGTRHGGAQCKSCRQTHRPTPRPGTWAVERRRRKLLDPRAPRGHRQAQRDTGEYAAGEQQREMLRTERKHQRTQHRDKRCGQHHRATTVTIRERSPQEKGGDNAQHVREQQRIDRCRGLSRLPVHHQQRSEFVTAPSDSEHRQTDTLPRREA